MKKTMYIILITLNIFSCQDAIEVDLETSQPRLVIDASLNWVKNTFGNAQYIKLTLTAPYYDQSVPPANGASVVVTNSKNNRFRFFEDGVSGIYVNNNFIAEINETYTLEIEYKNNTYIGTETLVPVVPIDHVEQKDNAGFSGDDIELKAYYTDPGGVENFYLFDFQSIIKKTSSLEVYNDEFTDGNQIFAFYSSDTIEPGDEISIRSSGLSERSYNFLNILLQQTDKTAIDPFELQPTSVRGNCVNTTNPENYPLGYFRVTETDVYTYIVK